MPRTGFEPAQDYSHQPLKLARLPIPPPGHFFHFLLMNIIPAFAGSTVLLTIDDKLSIFNLSL
jgi:hypothetical protein